MSRRHIDSRRLEVTHSQPVKWKQKRAVGMRSFGKRGHLGNRFFLLNLGAGHQHH
jgi:hypothetical protein